MTSEEIQAAVKKYNIGLTKPITGSIHCDDAKKVIKQIQDFLEEHNLENAELSIDEYWGSYELDIEGEEKKTDEDLERDIKWHREREIIDLEKKRVEYERLKKLFEGETK